MYRHHLTSARSTAKAVLLRTGLFCVVRFCRRLLLRWKCRGSGVRCPVCG
jgi:hypothetical protein